MYSLCPLHEDIRGSGSKAPVFLKLGTRWKCIISFTPRPLYPRVRVPSTHRIGDWIGHRAGLDRLQNRTNSDQCLESNHGFSAILPVAQAELMINSLEIVSNFVSNPC